MTHDQSTPKLCRTCGSGGPFYVRATECKPCTIRRAKEWQAANPDRHAESQRRRDLKSRYGIEPSHYKMLLEQQNGACGICKMQNAAEQVLHVDHDHETGLVRGLLCRQCNLMLQTWITPERLVAASEYLKLPTAAVLKMYEAPVPPQPGEACPTCGHVGPRPGPAPVERAYIAQTAAEDDWHWKRQANPKPAAPSKPKRPY